MKELLPNILIAAYGATGIVALIGYLPTIKDLHKDKKASANISSYILWTITAGVTFLYSLFILPNLPFQLVSGTNFLACAIVLILSVSLKRKN
jgi:hypothetical protein